MRNLINTYLLSISISLNILFLLLLILLLFTSERKIVYDLDQVRNQYLEDSRHYYMSGCLMGVEDYPNAIMKSTTTFCDDLTKENEEYFQDRMIDLGRTNYCPR